MRETVFGRGIGDPQYMAENLFQALKSFAERH